MKNFTIKVTEHREGLFVVEADEPNGILGIDWFVFKKGEPRIEGVWRWFDSHYTAGLGALMFGTAE